MPCQTPTWRTQCGEKAVGGQQCQQDEQDVGWGGGAKTLVLSLDRGIDKRSLTWSLYLSMALPLESYEE